MTEIILIDDSNFDLMINEMVIKKSISKNCLKFSNPKEGYEYIVNQIINSEGSILLFLDLNMPELNGWELLDLLRNCPEKSLAKINVIIVSNSNNPSDIKMSEKYSMVSKYMTKPLNDVKLHEALTKVTVMF